MASLIEPDIEGLAIAYLDPLVAPPISTTVPSSRPVSFVRIQAAGGSGVTEHVLAEAVLSVEAWAANTYAASILARTLAAYLRAWEGLAAGPSFIYSVRTTTPRAFPDPVSSSPRYVFTATVTARATDAA